MGINSGILTPPYRVFASITTKTDPLAGSTSDFVTDVLYKRLNLKRRALAAGTVNKYQIL
jgi:hypothetical protein